MKRLTLTVTGTVAGLAALLSFKTQTHPLTAGGPLPSAGSTPSTPTASAPTATAGSGPTSTGSAPKTYTGQAVTTRYGIVQVKVTVTNGRITAAGFVQLTAFDSHSQQINSQAGPQLLQETLQKQNVQIDTVSGASYTSEGYRESLQSALDKAGVK